MRENVGLSGMGFPFCQVPDNRPRQFVPLCPLAQLVWARSEWSLLSPRAKHEPDRLTGFGIVGCIIVHERLTQRLSQVLVLVHARGRLRLELALFSLIVRIPVAMPAPVVHEAVPARDVGLAADRAVPKLAVAHEGSLSRARAVRQVL